MKTIKIGKKTIGDGFPCFTIAEIGGSFKTFKEAKRLIDSAVEVGIDAVKFQTLEAETITIKNNYFDFDVTGHISQYENFKHFEISKDVQLKIVDYAKKKGIIIFSAPSHIKDLEIMKKMDLPVYKIGSDLACHIPILKEIAKIGKPMILSTGMCTLDEVRESVNAILETGNDQLAILHCISDYPTKPEETNLNVISALKKEFNLPVGLSDHNIDSTIALGASVIGANIIEKHYRDPQNPPSPDDPHALTKEEFSSLIQSIRLIEKAKGDGIKQPTKSEKKWKETNRVSIVSLSDIKSGQTITPDMIDVRRPGSGLEPKYFEKIIGMKATRDIPKETPLTFEMLE